MLAGKQYYAMTYINIDRAKTAIADFTPRARCYDFYINSVSHKKLTKVILDAAKVSKEDRILDIACGTGFVLRYLPPKAYKCGVDLCHAMLQKVPEWADAHKVQAHACALPFHDDTFDVITCIGAINIFDDNELHQVLNEVVRVLKEKGRFMVTVPAFPTPTLYDYLLYPFIYPFVKSYNRFLSTISGSNVTIEYYKRDINTITKIFEGHFDEVEATIRNDIYRRGMGIKSGFGIVVGNKCQDNYSYISPS